METENMEKLAGIVTEAARVLKERGARYGEDVLERTAALASLKLGREISAYECAIVLESLKDVRRSIEPTEPEHHIDGLNYRVLAASLKPEPPRPARTGNGSTALSEDISRRLAADLEKDMQQP